MGVCVSKTLSKIGCCFPHIYLEDLDVVTNEETGRRRVWNVPTARPSEDRVSFRVMSYNILARLWEKCNPGSEAKRNAQIAKIILEQDPDILFLQEVQEDTLDVFLKKDGLLSGYELACFPSNGRLYWSDWLNGQWLENGQAILVKKSRNFKTTASAINGSPSATRDWAAMTPFVTIEMNGTRLALINVHLDRFEQGGEQWDVITNFVNSQTDFDAVIIAGDFNNPKIHCRGYVDLGEEHNETRATCSNNYFQACLDHIIVSRNITCNRFESPLFDKHSSWLMGWKTLWKSKVINETGTDHLPIVADLIL